MKQTVCDPQPYRSGDSWNGESIWEYDGGLYLDDGLMQDHLFHNIYGNALDNSDATDDEEVKAVLIAGVWYWEVTS